jgi:hypothetical protein
MARLRNMNSLHYKLIYLKLYIDFKNLQILWQKQNKKKKQVKTAQTPYNL